MEGLVNIGRLVPLVTDYNKSEHNGAKLRTPRLTDVDHVAIIQAYQAGTSIGSLARTYGVSKSTISLVIKKAGLPRHHRGPTERQVDEAVRLYEQGWSSARIAERIGFNQATIWRHLTRRGVRMRSPNDRHY